MGYFRESMSEDANRLSTEAVEGFVKAYRTYLRAGIGFGTMIT